jgi:hypothetical protein
MLFEEAIHDLCNCQYFDSKHGWKNLPTYHRFAPDGKVQEHFLHVFLQSKV